MNKITVNGKEYPLRVTLGAFVNFKRNRGIDINEAGNDVDAVCYFMYECVRSACRVDGVQFELSFEEFADRIDLTELANFQNSQSSDKQTAASKKK
jgi:hypothetical protein